MSHPPLALPLFLVITFILSVIASIAKQSSEIKNGLPRRRSTPPRDDGSVLQKQPIYVLSGSMYRNGYVYIMTNNKNGTLYVGVTSDIYKRVREHKNSIYPGFTQRYGLKQLVYFEKYELVVDAIAREKQMKGGSRAKKIFLITETNPEWNDLAEGWYTEEKMDSFA